MYSLSLCLIWLSSLTGKKIIEVQLQLRSHFGVPRSYKYVLKDDHLDCSYLVEHSWCSALQAYSLLALGISVLNSSARKAGEI